MKVNLPRIFPPIRPGLDPIMIVAAALLGVGIVASGIPLAESANKFVETLGGLWGASFGIKWGTAIVALGLAATMFRPSHPVLAQYLGALMFAEIFAPVLVVGISATSGLPSLAWSLVIWLSLMVLHVTASLYCAGQAFPMRLEEKTDESH